MEYRISHRVLFRIFAHFWLLLRNFLVFVFLFFLLEQFSMANDIAWNSHSALFSYWCHSLKLGQPVRMTSQFWPVVQCYMQQVVGRTEVAGPSISNVFPYSKMLTWERPFLHHLMWWFEKQLLGSLPLPKSAKGRVERDAMSWSKSLSVCSWDLPRVDTACNGVSPKIALLCQA